MILESQIDKVVVNGKTRFDLCLIFDKEVSTSVKRALALLEPILILTLGLLIAGIVMSILVAILGVNQLVF